MTARAEELADHVTEPDELAEAISTAALALARRFAAGATLWCAAPTSRHHARHVAVEFVHPVIVGARSLPAATLDDLHDHDMLRAKLRVGDVLLVVADPRAPDVDDTLRRCAAWGVTSILVALDPPREPGLADHVISVRDERRTLLAYHLLWELTQIVFEHPGLLILHEDDCSDDVCITCSDEARIAEVTRTVADGLAEALDAGRPITVDVTLVPDVRPGDLVLVHAGLALQRVDGRAT